MFSVTDYVLLELMAWFIYGKNVLWVIEVAAASERRKPADGRYFQYLPCRLHVKVQRVQLLRLV